MPGGSVGIAAPSIGPLLVHDGSTRSVPRARNAAAYPGPAEKEGRVAQGQIPQA